MAKRKRGSKRRAAKRAVRRPVKRTVRRAPKRATRRPRVEYEDEDEELLDEMRESLRGERVLPAGTEFELTATTVGGTPDRTRGGRSRPERSRSYFARRGRR